jgi:wyosine [tRNA(Phe)-imidazoG37] synthetase (radical SAM superfamily)
MICFGPIPSRRLGKSLGINNIPSQKICSYSCIYCQVGITNKYSVELQSFYEPKIVELDVENHLKKLDNKNYPDYLTIVSNGEPTLDKNLKEIIARLNKFNIKIAVITNASLLSNPEVQENLINADWVSVKIDSGDEIAWKKINRPYKTISFQSYIQGIINFSNKFEGKLVSETMLVDGINDSFEIVEKTAELVSKVNPSIAYISIPTRPPAVAEVRASKPDTINQAFQIFSDKRSYTELILGFEGTNTGFTGNAEEDILNISSVHPIREDTLLELLNRNNTSFEIVTELITQGKIEEVAYKSKKFYIRNRKGNKNG